MHKELYTNNLYFVFLGNSYTYVNNLPGIIANIASSMGDTSFAKFKIIKD